MVHSKRTRISAHSLNANRIEYNCHLRIVKVVFAAEQPTNQPSDSASSSSSAVQSVKRNRKKEKRNRKGPFLARIEREECFIEPQQDQLVLASSCQAHKHTIKTFIRVFVLVEHTQTTHGLIPILIPLIFTFIGVSHLNLHLFMDPSGSQQAPTPSSSVTQVEEESPTTSQEDTVTAVKVKLKKPKSKLTKKVSWTEDTVDNEALGRKKSKCCCIYRKPRQELDESSESESETECEHCSGHVEAKHHRRTSSPPPPPPNLEPNDQGDQPESDPSDPPSPPQS